MSQGLGTETFRQIHFSFEPLNQRSTGFVKIHQLSAKIGSVCVCVQGQRVEKGRGGTIKMTAEGKQTMKMHCSGLTGKIFMPPYRRFSGSFSVFFFIRYIFIITAFRSCFTRAQVFDSGPNKSSNYHAGKKKTLAILRQSIIQFGKNQLSRREKNFHARPWRRFREKFSLGREENEKYLRGSETQNFSANTVTKIVHSPR